MPKEKKQEKNVEEHKLTFDPASTVPDYEDALTNSGKKAWRQTEEEKADWIFVMNRINNEMRLAQADFHTEWDNAKSIYECEITPDPFREAFKIPISHAMIDSAVAEEIDAFPDFAIESQEPEDRAKLPFLNAAKKYALWRTNWDKVKYEALKLRRIYGFCVVRVYFRRETRVIKERIPVRGDEGIKMGYKEVIDYPYDDIWFEVIDNPRRFLIGDSDRDIDSASDCALVTEVDWDAFKPMVQMDSRFKNLEFVKPGVEWKGDVALEGVEVLPQQRSPEKKTKVSIIEYWNKHRDMYLMIANGIIIRQTCLVDDHKELPFAVLHMHRRPHTFYSKGIPKLIESIEAAYNAIIQAEVRATKLAFPILVTDDDNAIDPRQIAPYPGVVLEGGLDRVDLKQLGSVPAEVYRLKDKLEEWLIWLTGTNIKQIFSADSPTNQRVGIEALKRESMLSRINANLRENEANFIVRLGNLLVQDIMQYYPVKKLRRLLPDEDVSEISDKDLIFDDNKKPVGIMEHRKIPVEGMNLVEVEDKKKQGQYTLKSDENGGSYILARPEYIRTKAKMDIRAVRPSAMGSSKEAKKMTFMELSDHAIVVNQAAMQLNAEPGGMDAQGNPTPGKLGKPIWNLEYLEAKLAEAHELPPDKALMTTESTKEKSPEQEFEDFISPLSQIQNRKPPPRPSMAPGGIQQAMNPVPPEMAQGQQPLPQQ